MQLGENGGEGEINRTEKGYKSNAYKHMWGVDDGLIIMEQLFSYTEQITMQFISAQCICNPKSLQRYNTNRLLKNI